MDMCVVRSVSVSSRLAGAARWVRLTTNQQKLQETSTEVNRKVIGWFIGDRNNWSRMEEYNCLSSGVTSVVQSKENFIVIYVHFYD